MKKLQKRGIRFRGRMAGMGRLPSIVIQMPEHVGVRHATWIVGAEFLLLAWQFVDRLL